MGLDGKRIPSKSRRSPKESNRIQCTLAHYQADCSFPKTKERGFSTWRGVFGVPVGRPSWRGGFPKRDLQENAHSPESYGDTPRGVGKMPMRLFTTGLSFCANPPCPPVFCQSIAGLANITVPYFSGAAVKKFWNRKPALGIGIGVGVMGAVVLAVRHNTGDPSTGFRWRGPHVSGELRCGRRGSGGGTFRRKDHLPRAGAVRSRPAVVRARNPGNPQNRLQILSFPAGCMWPVRRTADRSPFRQSA